MRPTSILGEDLEALGLYIEEDEHTVCLKYGEDVIARWWATTVRLASIRNTARIWAKKHDKEKQSV